MSQEMFRIDLEQGYREPPVLYRIHNFLLLSDKTGRIRMRLLACFTSINDTQSLNLLTKSLFNQSSRIFD